MTKILQTCENYITIVKSLDKIGKKIDTSTNKIRMKNLGGISMAGAIVNKVLDFLGVDTAGADEIENENMYDYNYDEDTEMEEESENRGFFNRKNKIINMPQAQQVRMVITQPTTFEQSEEICNYLKEKKSVIVSLEYVNKDVARRIVDFISGSVHALEGHIQKISNAIFLVAPVNYDITSDMAREEIKSKLSVSWLKNN